MRLYNVEPVKESFEWGEMDVITLGEKGRGRRLTIVPFHALFEDKGDKYDVALTKTGRPKIVVSEGAPKGWIAKLSSEGVYTRWTKGFVSVLKDDMENIEVLATGMGAFGDAGRLGSWNDHLVKVNEKITRIYVHPAGDWKRENFWLVFNYKSEPVKVNVDEVNLFSEMTGIYIPDEKKSEKRLNLTDINPENAKNLKTKKVLQKNRGTEMER